VVILGQLEKWSKALFGGGTGTVGENGAHLCVVVILGTLEKMDHSCVWW